jgi:hypothetical protein
MVESEFFIPTIEANIHIHTHTGTQTQRKSRCVIEV